MQVIVKGHDGAVTNGTKERATQKIEKVTRLFPRLMTAEIEFTENGGARAAVAKHRVEVTLTAKQHILRATARGPDPLTAVDRVVAKLETQVRRLKGKVTRKGRASGPGAPSIRTSS
jgi:ribosome hibernation promoting factor